MPLYSGWNEPAERIEMTEHIGRKLIRDYECIECGQKRVIVQWEDACINLICLACGKIQRDTLWLEENKYTVGGP